MEQGITSQQAAKRREEYGKNEITTSEQKTTLLLFLSQFPTVINAILFTAGLLSFFITDRFDGIFILLILLLNGILGFIQEYRAQKALQKLSSYVKPISRVFRDGKEHLIPTNELVPEDVVLLSEGDRIPADGRLILDHHIEIDESLLTGESLPITKNHNDTVLKGTLVTQGKGKMLVEKIGMQTRLGSIAHTLSTLEMDQSPLQKKIDTLSRFISISAIGWALLIIPIGLMHGQQLLPLTLLAVSIAIAAIPEGLPAVITIALAIGTNRMAKRNAIVRKMPAIETLGSVQVILVDKTGTLTQNNMKVKKWWTKKPEEMKYILPACMVANTATIVEKEGSHSPKDEWDVVGDKTDGALLLWATAQRKRTTIWDGLSKPLEEYAFDPQTQTISAVLKHDGKTHVFVRGAPEAILASSTQSETEKEKILTQVDIFAKEGLRVIGFGYKVEDHDGIPDRKHAESHLHFTGIVGIYDPPREAAHQAVEQARRAGIHTVMVTGDNELTALTIAKEVGLVEKDEDVLTGDQLKKLTDSQLDQIIGKINIFARSEPEDKLRLVEAFKRNGYVVGVTGDGVNDSLALKRADVGIAMGQSGTDVAKEAADIILLDDNFATLVGAIEEGRNIYNNILKSITYLLSGNLAQILFIFSTALFGLPSPLLPTDILWINLIADGLPALALAADTKDPSMLRHQPRTQNSPILTRERLIFITFLGVLLAGSLFVTFQLLLQVHTPLASRTLIFNLLVGLRLLVAFVVRGNMIFSFNKMLVLCVLAAVVTQVAINVIPFFETIFHLGL